VTIQVYRPTRRPQYATATADWSTWHRCRGLGRAARRTRYEARNGAARHRTGDAQRPGTDIEDKAKAW